MAKRNVAPDHPQRIRLDKWLWAARFFKTRSLAKQAIEGGKVHYNDARGKCGRDMEIGATLTIRQGWDERTVIVKALSDRRQGAPQAALLYEETAASLERRAAQAEQRRAQRAPRPAHAGKPSRREQRRLHGLKRRQLGSQRDPG